MNKIKEASFKAVNVVLTSATIVFAFVYGRGLINNAEFTGISVNYWLLTLSILFFILFYVLLAVHWLLICKLVDPNTPNKLMLSFFASQPYKYLPTSLFVFSYRAKFTKDLGMPIRKSTIAQLVENISIISTGSAFTILLLAYLHSLSSGLWFSISIVLFMLFLLLTQHNIKIPKTKEHINTRKLMAIGSVAVTGWVLLGLSFTFLSYAVDSKEKVLLLFSGAIASNIASILAFFAPGGIGIRELILKYYSASNVAVLAWRLLTLALDLLFGFIAALLINEKKQSKLDN